MDPFTTVHGIAAPLPMANMDTDVIMPKQFLKGIDRSGLRDGVFHHLRFDERGEPRPDFVLNRSGWKGAAFLVVGPNFGCGSSREHAVWGLMQLGIRAIVGTSFAGIFDDNCQRNGLLTVSLPEAEVERLMGLAADPTRNRLTIDLPAQSITADNSGPVFRFPIDALRKDRLTRGLDAVAATLDHAEEIRRFERAYGADRPWLGLTA
ncbi:3-isopropylmalate dehydratase small subunit [Azospirillum sp. sgz302134]